MQTVLTIAGSDCSGGAGIQADLKTIAAHGLYGMSVITALTAQNTTGVFGIKEISPAFVRKQLDCVFEDIRPNAVKIGMVSSATIVDAIADGLKWWSPENIVIDPVMISTSGRTLLQSDAVDALRTHLLPLADLVTPNLPEAEALCGFPIVNAVDMERAARAITQSIGCATLVKGGHAAGAADDVLCLQGKLHWFHGKRIQNPNTHGTGCTLSSAIACGLACGQSLPDSIAAAKDYLGGALAAGLNLGRGSGPLNHVYGIRPSKTQA